MGAFKIILGSFLWLRSVSYKTAPSGRFKVKGESVVGLVK